MHPHTPVTFYITLPLVVQCVLDGSVHTHGQDSAEMAGYFWKSNTYFATAICQYKYVFP